MPTRSIIVKLRPSTARPRSSRAASEWCPPDPTLFNVSVWATHAFVNGAARAYGDLLLQMRQGDVCDGVDDDGRDRVISAKSYRMALSERLHVLAVQAQGTSTVLHDAATVLADLRTLYAAVIPSYVKPNEGTAQDANAYLSKLVDPLSEAGEASAAKEAQLRILLPVLDRPELFALQARALFADERANAILIKGPGAPSAWATLYKNEGPSDSWLEAVRVAVVRLAVVHELGKLTPFLDDKSVFAAKSRELFASAYVRSVLVDAPSSTAKWAKLFRKEGDTEAWLTSLEAAVRDIASDPATSARPAVARLNVAGAFPLMAPYGKGRIEDRARGVLTKFERMAFGQLVAGLNPWESKRAMMQASRNDIDKRLNGWDDRFGDSHADARAALAVFEAEELQRLRVESLADDRTTYRVMSRELRGWRELREYLTTDKGRGASAAQRAAWLANLQTKLGRAFGGHRLLAFLAAPPQQWIADHPAGDVVTRIARRNELQRQRDRARVLPIWTAPDPVHHPRFALFDTPANTNNPPFTLSSSDGKLYYAGGQTVKCYAA